MKKVLLLLSLSLSVMAIGSVSHADPPGPQLPTTETIGAYKASFVEPLAYIQVGYKYYHADVELATTLHGVPAMSLATATPEVAHYLIQSKSLSNYWQGPPPYGNA